MPGSGLRFPASWWLAQLSLLVLAAVHHSAVVRCLGRCFVDLAALQSGAGVQIHVADQRLNAWILGWVQRALLGRTESFFDANIFYPATGTLTGSEHMLGMAIPLLPLGAFGADAVALHQAGLVFSGLVLAWSSFALVRWATGSIWAAWLAGVLAMLAPWRLGEMAHLQLLSAHWVPLIWLLVARIARQEVGVGAGVALAVVLGFQLLSSYYIAYFTTLSLAVLLAVIWLRDGLRLRSVLRLFAAALVPYAALVLFSLPYLERDSALELLPRVPLPDFATPAQAWQSLAPQFTASFGVVQPDTGYMTPAITAVLVILSLSLWAVRRRPEHEQAERSRGLAIGLACIVVVAFVMSLGQRLWIGGEMWMLPAGWASAWVPGFENMRGPLRWQILIGVALAPLAGIGVWALERWIRSAGLARARVSIGVVRAVLLFLMLSSLSWRALPVTEAIDDSAGSVWGYRALADLDPGPVLEIPWPMDFGADAVEGSRYTLASTLHWKPILNGFTAYRPPSYAFLQRVAQTLPDPEAVARLRELAGLRWIVVHVDRLSPTQRGAWQRPVPGLTPVYRDPATWIFEVAAPPEIAPSWTEALRSQDPRARTLSGLAREPLALGEVAGELRATLPSQMPSFRSGKRWVPVPFVIENRGSQAWPGLDVQPEGLVELQYRFSRGGVVVFEALAPLDRDVLPGQRQQGQAYLQARVPAGEYLLELGLAQRLADEIRPLPVKGVVRSVRVVE